MTGKSFIGGMIIVGLVVFLIICMSIRFCQVNYTLMDYTNSDGDELSTCCYYNSTEFDAYNDVCIGAPGNATDNFAQKDLLENIKVANLHFYFILIIVLMGLAVLGVVFMIG